MSNHNQSAAAVIYVVVQILVELIWNIFPILQVLIDNRVLVVQWDHWLCTPRGRVQYRKVSGPVPARSGIRGSRGPGGP